VKGLPVVETSPHLPLSVAGPAAFVFAKTLQSNNVKGEKYDKFARKR
jgi:hypothetical protein